ncbi:hypothetical protein [Sphingomonas endolithica]|jgi:hypothetical protein|uniref:hypothetical protein n=1 Tax=Sphingomonas endolithica TaxID=2972485 RepID=UPI0021AFD722|nr:hypothetical protein [Sphingomonas sp. ZFBP2030]
MTGPANPAEASASPAFEPAAWLQALVAIGGGYALASGRKLWLVVQDCPADELTPVMAQLVGKPGRVEAVREAIERRQNGEALS